MRELMAGEQLDERLAVFKDLTDESRLRIMGFLAEREHSVKELSERIGLKQPTVARHLAKLSRHDLVSTRKDGTTHVYRFNRAVLRRCRIDLFSLEHVTSVEAGASQDA